MVCDPVEPFSVPIDAKPVAVMSPPVCVTVALLPLRLPTWILATDVHIGVVANGAGRGTGVADDDVGTGVDDAVVRHIERAGRSAGVGDANTVGVEDAIVANDERCRRHRVGH